MSNSVFAQGFILLCIALLLFLNAGSGLVTGRVILVSRHVKRSQNVRLFWSAVVISAIGGIAALVAFAVWSSAPGQSSAPEHNQWWVLLMAAWFLFNAIDGLATGSAMLIYTPKKRYEDGYLFWWAVIMSACFGVGSLVGFFH